MILGPDAQRYLAAAQGVAVPRPFCYRRLLPAVCKTDARRWWLVWWASWVVLAVACFLWLWQRQPWEHAAAGAALLCALPGVLGPRVVIPVGVDLPASALTLAGVALWTLDHPWAVPFALSCWMTAAAIKETAPVHAALWAWHPGLLLLLLIPMLLAWRHKPGPDPLGARFDEIARHPVRTALQAHAGRWRDGWLMVAPWGATVLALYSLELQTAVALAVAYAQLLVATDSVRLYQHTAGPVMAAAAAATIPTVWLPLAVVLHVVWWRTPERI